MSAEALYRNLYKFDESVDRTFEKIDDEIGAIVEKLAAFAHIVADQNNRVEKQIRRLERLEKRRDNDTE